MFVHVEYLDDTVVQWESIDAEIMLDIPIMIVCENKDLVHFVNLSAVRYLTLESDESRGKRTEDGNGLGV